MAMARRLHRLQMIRSRLRLISNAGARLAPPGHVKCPFVSSRCTLPTRMSTLIPNWSLIDRIIDDGLLKPRLESPERIFRRCAGGAKGRL